MQLVVSPALQELVREADIPVELQHDRPFSDSLQAEWQRLNVPVRVIATLGSGWTDPLMGIVTNLLTTGPPMPCTVSVAGPRWFCETYILCNSRCSPSGSTRCER